MNKIFWIIELICLVSITIFYRIVNNLFITKILLIIGITLSIIFTIINLIKNLKKSNKDTKDYLHTFYGGIIEK